MRRRCTAGALPRGRGELDGERDVGRADVPGRALSRRWQHDVRHHSDRRGLVVARGTTDTARLRSGELVYTGVLRTPVAAIVRSVPLRGRRCRVSAEYFAASADVHLWLGRIGEDDYTCETPDGRGRSRREAGARLARMVCADFEVLGEANITAIAEYVAAAQLDHVVSGVRQVERRLGARCPKIAVVAGQGAFLAGAAAQAAGLEPSALASALGADVARATPAAAVAYLLREALDSGSVGHASRSTIERRTVTT